jgi:hypothetical protein
MGAELFDGTDGRAGRHGEASGGVDEGIILKWIYEGV